MLLMEGEKEAMDGNKIVYFDLFPERNYKEGSAAQTHFRLVESQFYRLISGTGIRWDRKYTVYIHCCKIDNLFERALETI